MTVVCGNNRILKNNLEMRFEEYIRQGRMEILGFVGNIPELMARCHVIVTKPGGLTSSEAINMSIPMLIPFSIPGQEQENTDFLVESGMAMAVNGADDINEKINLLMDQPHLYDSMSQNMSQLSANYSLDKVVELSERMMAEFPCTDRPAVLSGRTFQLLRTHSVVSWGDGMERPVDVMILTAPFGNGHNSAAQAIIEELGNTSPELNVRVVDLFGITAPILKGTFSETYHLLTRKRPARHLTICCMS